MSCDLGNTTHSGGGAGQTTELGECSEKFVITPLCSVVLTGIWEWERRLSMSVVSPWLGLRQHCRRTVENTSVFPFHVHLQEHRVGALQELVH